LPAGAILGAAVIGGGASIFGASKAAKAQKKAAKSGIKSQEKMLETARSDLAPYRETGQSALFSLADMYGLERPGSEGGEAFSDSALEAFRMSPDYQVAMKEGVRASDMSAAAQGNLKSGGQIREITELGSDLGSRYFGSYLDRLAKLAGLGQNSAAGSASHAMNAGSNLSNLQLAKGEAQASGIVGMTNAFTKTLDTGLDNYMTYQDLTAGGSTAVSPRYGEIY
jgi:hypothetical protein